MNTLNVYYEALERLKQNKPLIIKRPYIINKDTVALEAGKQRGAIKKGRPRFTSLYNTITDLENELNAPMRKLKERKDHYENELIKQIELYEQSLNRELMLIERVAELEKNQKTEDLPLLYVNRV